MTDREFTPRQLSLYNGREKPEVYVAYKGLVYDVTHSNRWKTGIHYEHWSGQDLTDEMADAPHADSVFERFVPIGKLKV